MNARQKAKKYKRLYTEIAKMPYPHIEVYPMNFVPLKHCSIVRNEDLEQYGEMLIQDNKKVLIHEASKYIDVKIFDDCRPLEKRIEMTLVVATRR